MSVATPSQGIEGIEGIEGIASRVKALDWSKICADLDAQGWAILPKLLYFR